MIFAVRFGIVAGTLASAMLVVSARAHADPGTGVLGPGWFEVGGFTGVDALPSDVRLGDSTKPEQRPQTAIEFGGRVAWLAIPGDWVALALEAEVGLTASWTGFGFGTGRDSYFAPVIDYRAAVVLRFASNNGWIAPHVLLGGGGATVMTASPYMSDSTDAQWFYGVGATIELSDGVQLRVDGRQGFLPTQTGIGETYELTAGVSAVIGRPKRARAIAAPPPVEHVAPVAPPPVEQHPIVAVKRVPQLPPVVPPPLPIPPTPPAAIDPNLDSDGDGIPDVRDACPKDPETRNGFEDEDGCPDVVPADISNALAGARAVRFEPRRVRLTDAAKAAFDGPAAVLRAHPHLHVIVIGHPGDDDAGGELARKRAEVVKWHLVEEGVPADQLDVLVGAPGGNPIELLLAPRPPKS